MSYREFDLVGYSEETRHESPWANILFINPEGQEPVVRDLVQIIGRSAVVIGSEIIEALDGDPSEPLSRSEVLINISKFKQNKQKRLQNDARLSGKPTRLITIGTVTYMSS